MNIKTSELTGAALDWVVHQAWCEGACHDEPFPSYATDWAQGGPIIEREGIVVISDKESEGWIAAREFWYLQDSADRDLCSTGSTHLTAAMRCFVESKLGDTVNIPDELTGEKA